MAGTTLISEAAPNSAGPVSRTNAAERDLWIFRDGKQSVPGPEVIADLKARIARCAHSSEPVLDALIEAGELEAALADSGCESAPTAARVTEALASVFLGNSDASARAAEQLSPLEPPERLTISPPEGFTYYALHPCDFAKVSSRVPAEPSQCAVIGVRSIGTTLSAVVVAALLQQGRQATRITVRPTGHPYSREMNFSPDEMQWIEQNCGAQFLVVDEGPGRSGSTFLAVAEALLRAGVGRDRITMVGSREPDIFSLCAENAPTRWREFRFVTTTPSTNQRFENCTYAGGGDWRRFFLPTEESWPESWMQMERLKFISPDWKQMYKFEGMGPIGARARDRALALAAAGLGPAATEAGGGFVDYELVRGRPMQASDVNEALLDRMADYCAFRHSEFATSSSSPSHLREMLQFNVMQEFGVELSLAENAFYTDRAVVTDGRMQPYEWIASADQFVKTDGVDHGDNHFFPGPCDIAWDISGIIVEWWLDQNGLEYLLRQFRHRSGVDITEKLPAYNLAYSIFRMGFCQMAISTVAKGSTEEQRLTSACDYYRVIAKRLLEVSPAIPRAA